jgi:hypothetical protein
MKDWNQDKKMNMNQMQDEKQNQDKAQEMVDITGRGY